MPFPHFGAPHRTPASAWNTSITQTPAPANSIAVSDGMAYVAQGNTIYALSLSTGAIAASFTAPALSQGQPGAVNAGGSVVVAADGSAVFFGVARSNNSYNSQAQVTVFSLALKTLQENWTCPLWTIPTISFDEVFWAFVPLVCGNDVVYVGSNNCVAALNPANGTILSQAGQVASYGMTTFFPYSSMTLSADATMLYLANFASTIPQQTSTGSDTVSYYSTLQSYACSTATPLGAASTAPDFTNKLTAGNNPLCGHVSMVANAGVLYYAFASTIYRIASDTITSAVPLPPASGNGLAVSLSLSHDGKTLFGYTNSTAFGLDASTLRTLWMLEVPSIYGAGAVLAGPDGCIVATTQYNGLQVTLIDQSGSTLVAHPFAGVCSGGTPALTWVTHDGQPQVVATGGGSVVGLPAALSATLPQVTDLTQELKTKIAEKEKNGPGAWMTHRAATLGGIALRQISIPGSHDSGTFAINSNSAVGLDAEHTTPKSLIAAWAKAQGQNFYEQLTSGIRYLDLRVQNVEMKFSITHTLISTELDTLFTQIRQFYDEPENAKEILILDFSHFYGFCDGNIVELKAKLDQFDSLPPAEQQKVTNKLQELNLTKAQVAQKVATGRKAMKTLVETVRLELGGIHHESNPVGQQQPPLSQAQAAQCTGFLINASNGINVTPNQIWNGSGRIIVMWDNNPNITLADHPYLWPANANRMSYWPDTQNTAELQKKLNTEVNKAHSTFWVLQGVLTPGTTTIAGGLIEAFMAPAYFATKFLPGSKTKHAEMSLQEVAQNLNPQLDEWLIKDWGGQAINIVIADWTNISPYVATVISLNNRFNPKFEKAEMAVKNRH